MWSDDARRTPPSACFGDAPSDSLATLPLSKVLERQHSCRREATLQVLHGRVRLSAGDSSWEGRTGTVLKATLTQTGEGGSGWRSTKFGILLYPRLRRSPYFYASRGGGGRPAGKGCGPVTPSHRIRDPTTIRWVSLEELGRHAASAQHGRDRGDVVGHGATASTDRRRAFVIPRRRSGSKSGLGPSARQLRAPASHVEPRFG